MIDLNEDPPPVGALRRWQRLLAVVTAVLVAAAVIVAIRIGTSRPALQFDNRVGWLEALAAAPPRGGLAADQAFLDEMTARVTALVRDADTFHPELVAADGRRDPRQEVRILYADDIDGRRIVLIALQLPLPPIEPTGDNNPFRRMPGRTKFVWLIGPRGATAGYLATALTRGPLPELRTGTLLPEPLLVAVIGTDLSDRDGSPTCVSDPDCLMIALAPPQCSVATAPAAEPSDFQPEPTGSYLVRTARTFRLELWQVTCDGVVREQRRMPSMWLSRFHEREEVAAALAETRGLTAEQRLDENLPRQAAFAIELLQRTSGLPLTGPPQVVWAGPTTNLDRDRAGLAPDPDGAILAMVTVAPTLDSRWLAGYTVNQSRPNAGLVVADASFTLPADPTAPASMLAIADPFTRDQQILAVGPTTATSMRLADPVRGGVTESPVVDGKAVLTPMPPIPADRLADASVAAVDASGTVVATTTVTTAVPYPHVDRWDEPTLCCP